MALVARSVGPILLDDGRGGTVAVQVAWVGVGDPLDALGGDGDAYLDVSAGVLWGQKAGGSWAGTGPLDLHGPQGDPGADGRDGAEGPVGPAGAGVVAGGAAAAVLRKASGADYDTEWAALTAADVGALADDATAAGSLTGTYPAPGIADGAVAVRHLDAALSPSGTATDGDEAVRALGTGAGEAAPGASAVGHVAHGATAGTVRPAGYAVVVWVGSVDPTNKVAGDLWVRTV